MTHKFSSKDTALVKGVAICCMLLHHCFLSASRFEDFDISFYPFSQTTVVHIAQLGKCCVGLFVFLSAYGMARAFLSRSQEAGFFGKQSVQMTLQRLLKMLSGFWWPYLFAILGCLYFVPSRLSSIYGTDHFLTSGFYVLMDVLGLSSLVGTPTLIHTWWYMGFAIALILLFPLLILIYQKVGIMLIPLCFLGFCALGKEESLTLYNRWLLLLPALGIVFADHCVLERCKSWHILKNRLLDTALRLIVLSALTFFFFRWVIQSGLWGVDNLTYVNILLDACMVVVIVLWTYLFLADLPVIAPVFQYLGKHSMNIYLIHNFLRGGWFNEHIYSQRHFVLVTLTLLVESLLISIVIEVVKKYSGYNALIQKAVQKLQL